MTVEHCMVRTNLIFELIACAEDYGFNDDVLLSAFAEMLDHRLSPEIIEEHARAVEAQEGSTEEDYENVKSTLEKFQETYGNQDE